MTKRIISISMDTEEDADIVAFLDTLRKNQVSAFFREAAREKISRDQADLTNRQVVDTLLAALDEIKRNGVTGPVVTEPAQDPEFINTLKGLGEW
jgi:hypothetical protein